MQAERWCGALALASLAACQASPSVDGIPGACAPLLFTDARLLQLPPAVAPSDAPLNKSEALKFANAVPLGGGVGDVGEWVDAGEGWKSWRLKIRSDGAKSLSLHMNPFLLPIAAEAWLCSPDGRRRQGPLTGAGPAGSGEVWTAGIPGPELWLEILSPADATAVVQMRIVEAFAAFR